MTSVTLVLGDNSGIKTENKYMAKTFVITNTSDYLKLPAVINIKNSEFKFSAIFSDYIEGTFTGLINKDSSITNGKFRIFK